MKIPLDRAVMSSLFSGTSSASNAIDGSTGNMAVSQDQKDPWLKVCSE